jgi:hypothetical protein
VTNLELEGAGRIAVRIAGSVRFISGHSTMVAPPLSISDVGMATFSFFFHAMRVVFIASAAHGVWPQRLELEDVIWNRDDPSDNRFRDLLPVCRSKYLSRAFDQVVEQMRQHEGA